MRARGCEKKNDGRERMKPTVKNLSDLTHILHGLNELLPASELQEIQLQHVKWKDIEPFDKDRFDWLVRTFG